MCPVCVCVSVRVCVHVHVCARAGDFFAQIEADQLSSLCLVAR